MSVVVEQSDPAILTARTLLEAHEADMRARYPGGRWSGTGGRKDMLWLAWPQRPAGEYVRDAVGVVALRELDPETVEVKHLFVDAAARRQGVAGALMDAFEAEARRRGATVVLETGVAQPEALAFYAARGYTERDRYPGSEHDGAGSVYLMLAGAGAGAGGSS